MPLQYQVPILGKVAKFAMSKKLQTSNLRKSGFLPHLPSPAGFGQFGSSSVFEEEYGV